MFKYSLITCIIFICVPSFGTIYSDWAEATEKLQQSKSQFTNLKSQEYTYEFTASCRDCGQCGTNPKIIEITNSNQVNDVKYKLDQDTCDPLLNSEYHDILYYINKAIHLTTEGRDDCPRARSGICGGYLEFEDETDQDGFYYPTKINLQFGKFKAGSLSWTFRVTHHD